MHHSKINHKYADLNNNDIIQKSDEKSLIRTIKLQKFSDSIITMETNKRS